MAGLREMLAGSEPILAPGCWDPFTALMVERAGFSCAYLSGASLAYMRLGRSDIGLTGLSDVLDVTGAITDRISIPLVVDIDNGYGNALNVQRAVRLVERAGAGAVQLEDQTAPKRCGHLSGKSVITAAEMVGKIKAAADARRNAETVLIARTDAIAVNGYADAIERAERYCEAGADVLFIEAPESAEQMREIGERFSARVPLLANMVEGGRTPISSLPTLAESGFKLVIYPGGLARAFAKMAEEFLASLREHGTTQPFLPRMQDFKGLNGIIGTPELLELGRRYDADAQEADR
jgi:2-methylisocitrate lyase-like PEP mutase family enzyme